MDKVLTIKNSSASNGKGMNFCLDSVDLKKKLFIIVQHQIILNNLCYSSSGLGAL